LALDAKSNGHPENLAASQFPEFENHVRPETEKILFAALRDVFSTWRRQEIEKLS
jgi:hypothetical protein